MPEKSDKSHRLSLKNTCRESCFLSMFDPFYLESFDRKSGLVLTDIQRSVLCIDGRLLDGSSLHALSHFHLPTRSSLPDASLSRTQRPPLSPAPDLRCLFSMPHTMIISAAKQRSHLRGYEDGDPSGIFSRSFKQTNSSLIPSSSK